MTQTQRKEFTGAKLGKYAFVLGSAVALAGRAGAQTTVAGFSFENSYSTGAAGTVGTGASTGGTSGMLMAEVGLGTAIGVHAAATTVYSFPAGYASGHAFSSNGWAVGDYYQFTINAATYSNLGVSFDMARSATGPNGFSLQYSADNGVSFTTFTTFAAGSGAFSTSAATPADAFTFDFSAVPALNDNTDIFRLVSDGTNSTGGAVAATGTARVDNFTVATVPEPSSVALLSIAGAGAVMMAARRRKTA